MYLVVVKGKVVLGVKKVILPALLKGKAVSNLKIEINIGRSSSGWGSLSLNVHGTKADKARYPLARRIFSHPWHSSGCRT